MYFFKLESFSTIPQNNKQLKYFPEGCKKYYDNKYVIDWMTQMNTVFYIYTQIIILFVIKNR